MDSSLWFIFCVAYIGITFSPGPNVLIVLGHAAKYGFRSIFIILGVGLGVST
ncbi:MAG: hypothetical protein COC24_005305 [Alphaproteobacteria bacterium]|nr:hypothetical protein [Alphaproteobacteria bacterium]